MADRIRVPRTAVQRRSDAPSVPTGQAQADMGEVNRHWRARYRLTFAPDPRELDSYERTYRYSAWIGAATEDDARALLEARLAQIGPELTRWELDSLVDATDGAPEVIAIWEGEGD